MGIENLTYISTNNKGMISAYLAQWEKPLLSIKNPVVRYLVVSICFALFVFFIYIVLKRLFLLFCTRRLHHFF